MKTKTKSSLTGLPKLSRTDPVSVCMNKMAELLEPFTRQQQLKILASACIAVGDYTNARAFIDAAEAEPEEVTA